jgi:phage shock protein A
MRSSIAESEKQLFDANSIRILEQQIRDAAAALELAKRELACVMAQQASEQRASAALASRIQDLEKGGADAISHGDEALASEVAIVIAACEDEKRDRDAAVARHASEIARLRKASDGGRTRLAELRRGLEMSRAQEALLRAGANGRRALAAGTGSLREAEATLDRIRDRHRRTDDTSDALDALDRVESGANLDDRLAAAGFGPNTRSKPADVLARLRAQARGKGPAAPSPDQNTGA